MSSDLENYRTELEKNGAIAFVPRGNSMWPILKNHKQSVIVVKKTEKLKRFDVALYYRGESCVLHRVMKPTEFGYIICGDSQFTLEKVSEEQVFGVMKGFYRGKRFIECTDEKYIESVENWYGHEKMRKIRLDFFFKSQRAVALMKAVVRKFLRIFKRSDKSL